MLSKEEIGEAMMGKLPGSLSHRKMWIDDEDLRFVNKNLHVGAKKSAVTILLYPSQGHLSFLLMQRVAYSGVHSAQFSLPGGKQEDGETAQQAAMREMEEETGVVLRAADYVAELSPLYVPPSNFMIYPFVAYINKVPVFTPNPEEVAKLFTVPLNQLLKKSALVQLKTQVWHKNKTFETSVPAFYLNNNKVWGATAMILNEFKDLIIKDID